jgi:hypothetical protein
MRKNAPPKQRYPPTKLHGVTTQKTTTLTITGVRISEMKINIIVYSVQEAQYIFIRFASHCVYTITMYKFYRRRNNFYCYIKHYMFQQQWVIFRCYKSCVYGYQTVTFTFTFVYIEFLRGYKLYFDLLKSFVIK